MEQMQSRISTRLQATYRELNAANPDRKRLQEQARYVDREMQRLQREYRNMGEELSLE
jgi:predicted transcriptional regulator